MEENGSAFAPGWGRTKQSIVELLLRARLLLPAALCWLTMDFPPEVRSLRKHFRQGDNLQIDSARFPDGLLWGLASAAYQVEGAWNTVTQDRRADLDRTNFD